MCMALSVIDCLVAGMERQIVFLTDGGISHYELDPILSLLSGDGVAKQTHVFCLGIGHGVHRPLLDSMAER